MLKRMLLIIKSNAVLRSLAMASLSLVLRTAVLTRLLQSPTADQIEKRKESDPGQFEIDQRCVGQLKRSNYYSSGRIQ